MKQALTQMAFNFSTEAEPASPLQDAVNHLHAVPAPILKAPFVLVPPPQIESAEEVEDPALEQARKLGLGVRIKHLKTAVEPAVSRNGKENGPKMTPSGVEMKVVPADVDKIFDRQENELPVPVEVKREEEPTPDAAPAPVAKEITVPAQPAAPGTMKMMTLWGEEVDVPIVSPSKTAAIDSGHAKEAAAKHESPSPFKQLVAFPELFGLSENIEEDAKDTFVPAIPVGPKFEKLPLHEKLARLRAAVAEPEELEVEEPEATYYMPAADETISKAETVDEVEANEEPEAIVEAETDVQPVTDVEPETDVEFETDVQPETDIETEMDVETEMDAAAKTDFAATTNLEAATISETATADEIVAAGEIEIADEPETADVPRPIVEVQPTIEAKANIESTTGVEVGTTGEEQATSATPTTVFGAAVIAAEKPPATDALSDSEGVSTTPKSKRGRKSLKEVAAEADLIEIPADEILFSKQYYSMGEVSEMFRVNQSLLRFWESEFSILQPKKNKKGDRHFRPIDIKNLHLIYHLLRQRKYTIEGAKEFLKKNKKADQRFEAIQRLQQIRAFLLELKAQL